MHPEVQKALDDLLTAMENICVALRILLHDPQECVEELREALDKARGLLNMAAARTQLSGWPTKKE